ncbi:hypothetical protein AVEN_78044-1 [Araneus ventricosus]|uniref:Uncharacterized protein n=1 Tax=Araneus ventricosus TaxID=182803 RepID=A0A4Y2FQ96_ARAVE|nr:hypothetical protein AVEN_78044-1 [Araneus ventricosus]
MTQAENVNTDFLPIIYDIIRSIEKETYETTQKPHENADSNLKIPELRTKLQQCREQIQKLPGIDYTKEEQQRRNKSEYKNSVINLDSDILQSKIAGPGCSFILKEHDIQTEDQFKHLIQRENVMKLSATEVKDLLFLMANIKIDTFKYNTILRYLDEKCALSVERWPLDLSFYVLDAWFIIWGPKVFRRHYYSAITSLWGRRLKKCSKSNLILMLYFIGMSKEAPPFLMEAIEDKMETFASDFSDEECAIACLSFFKTSKRMSSELLLKQSCQAAKNLLLKNDRFNVISILKCFRNSKYYDDALWTLLKEYTLKESYTFNFVECTNFLATFSTQNVYDYELFKSLEKHGILNLKTEKDSLTEEEFENLKTHPSLRSRIKDIARFLWALANVGHAMENTTVDFLLDNLKQRIDVGEFDKQIHILIDCLQSLSLTGYYPSNILSSVLQMSTLRKINYSYRSKPRYQLYFLQRSTQIEAPDVEIDMKNLFDPIPKNLETDIKERKGFGTLMKILSQTSIKDYKTCYLMPHIMISGIIFSIKTDKANLSQNGLVKNFKLYEKCFAEGIFTNKVKHLFGKDRDYICVEILDPTVCNYGGTEPTGLMKTKIRQLKKINIKVITLSVDEINKLASKNISKEFEDITKIIELL